MKLAFSSNAFVRYTLLETIRLLAETGYRGIEIMADVPHAYPPNLGPSEVGEIRSALERYRMEISNVSSFMLRAIGDIYHPSWIEADPELRNKRIEHTINSIELAHSLGAQTISTGPGGPLDGMEPERAIKLFRDGLRQIEAIAGKKNVRVLIEPEPELMIENGAQFKEFCKELDPEIFGLNFDIGHFFCVGEDPAAMIVELKDYIGHFHIEDIGLSRVHHHLLLGDGALDFAGIFDAMERIGYNDFVTVELYTYEDRPVEAARHAIDFFRKASFGVRNFFSQG
ncbi:MAG: sugar phosphate isomerase/epimerase [Deltaproteobacteria bacterium]|jgi:sugar phosphate isomerase/epimerase|nr:sugar phosphate isomerase/epimerase [Deltaproteobacteria bacterium]